MVLDCARAQNIDLYYDSFTNRELKAVCDLRILLRNLLRKYGRNSSFAKE